MTGGRVLQLFPAGPQRLDIHRAYFVTDGITQLMRQILRGLDRGALDALGRLKGNERPAKSK